MTQVLASRFSFRTFAAFAAVTIISAVTLSHSASAAPPSAADKEKLDQIAAIDAQMNRICTMEDLLDPKYRKALTPQETPLLRKKVDLLRELEASGGIAAPNNRHQRMVDLAILAYFGEPAADPELDQAAKDEAPAAALIGKLGLCMRDWWKAQTADDQAKVVERLKKLAQENPTNDYITNACLTLAKNRPATPELAEALRSLVEKDLKGLVAVRYRSTPNREGRPLTISGVAVTGDDFSTAKWKGKVVLVDFWATWCPPCRAEMPQVIKLYNDYHDKGLEIIGVSCDSRKPDLQHFLRDNKDMAWPQLFGPQGPTHWHMLANKFGVRQIPTAYLIDRNGILRTMEARGRLEKLVPELLAEKVTQ